MILTTDTLLRAHWYYRQYVAAIPHAVVEGEAGLVYDRSKNVYHETYMFPSASSGFLRPMPQVSEPEEVKKPKAGL